MVRELVGKEASQATQRHIKAHLGTISTYARKTVFSLLLRQKGFRESLSFLWVFSL